MAAVELDRAEAGLDCEVRSRRVSRRANRREGSGEDTCRVDYAESRSTRWCSPWRPPQPLAAADDQKIWTGVYSADQAAVGKTVFEANCATCHRADLSGDRGPALKGDPFFSSWENGSVSSLFLKIKETMPKNRASSLTDDNYVSIVAYLLQANAFPPSTKGVALDTDDLEDIQIERKGGSSKKGIPNFALVQVVGCLTQGQDRTWRLTRTSRAGRHEGSAAEPTGTERGRGHAARDRDIPVTERQPLPAGRPQRSQDGSQGAAVQSAQRRSVEPDVARCR